MKAPPQAPLRLDEKAYYEFQRDFIKWAVAEMQARTEDRTARHSVLLVSPGLKVYEVTVGDLGALSTTLVAG